MGGGGFWNKWYVRLLLDQYLKLGDPGSLSPQAGQEGSSFSAEASTPTMEQIHQTASKHQLGPQERSCGDGPARTEPVGQPPPNRLKQTSFYLKQRIGGAEKHGFHLLL